MKAWLIRLLNKVPGPIFVLVPLAAMLGLIWLLMTLTGAQVCGNASGGSLKGGWAGGICFR